MLCPAHMLGYLFAIRLAALVPPPSWRRFRLPHRCARSVPRFCLCAKRRAAEWKTLSRLGRFFVGARYIVPGADTWREVRHPPRTQTAPRKKARHPAELNDIHGLMWSAGACSRCWPPRLAWACSPHQPKCAVILSGVRRFLLPCSLLLRTRWRTHSRDLSSIYHAATFPSKRDPASPLRTRTFASRPLLIPAWYHPPAL
jgi:hypothetical protein